MKKVPFVPVFIRDIPEEFLKVSRVVYPWDATSDTPKLIGVPPHLILMAEIEDLKNKIERLKVTIKSNMNNALDKREVGDS